MSMMQIHNEEKQVEYRKGHFSNEEDELIKKYIKEHEKYNWNEVSVFVGTRSSKQCRERYFGHLDESVKKDPLTPSQVKLIGEFIKENGFKWAKLSRKLNSGHTPNMLKNKWHQQISK
ncbi:7302_t:CDS:2 [Diversispora eburnea]|uniref:7302_t:CDS:1 n=1 Tax=Diversispora eburnea TaxID=1213867 RepID=A0A9N8ZJM7_9GLOM|nr:7302_t:CDS:2 [Diversispora eburnea]